MTDFENFVRTHLGCGNVQSSIWFVGPEPAGSIDHIDPLVQTFVDQGRPSITSLRKDLIAINETKFFEGEKPKLQKYWSAVIRTYLSALGADTVSTEAVREYQQNVLCGVAPTRGPLLIETSSLPSPNTGTWAYSKFADQIPELSTRRNYENLIGDRLALIANLAQELNPRVIVFMGTTYQHRWKMVMSRIKANSAAVLTVPHPNSRPTVKNEDWVRLGQDLRKYLN